jgi:dTDP-L-rhamnose 4-epimerase
VRILITGGAGFIGSWLAESLARQGHGIVVLDNLSPQIHGSYPATRPAWLDLPNFKFERGDVRDKQLLDRLLAEVDAVVHLAAETGTGQSMYQISHYFDVNVQATACLFELVGLKHRQIKTIVLASSRSIYGEGAYELGGELFVPPPRSTSQLATGNWEPVGPGGEALKLIGTPESAAPRPASVYAASKLAIEHLGSVFASAFDCSVAALRFQNVYGERQSLRNPYTGILSIFSNRMRRGLPVSIFEDGNESRDFVHVQDAVLAIELALNRARGLHTLNIGSGKPTTVIDVAKQLRSLLGSKSDLSVTGEFRAGDIRHCYADISKAEQEFGFQPSVNLDEGLSRFVRWVQTQPVEEDRSEKALHELGEIGLGKVSSKFDA